MLSGRFATAAAARCLEYLIRRFKIHVYNVEAAVTCALPYHATAEFVKLVQLAHLEGTSFYWLKGVKEKGAAPPRDGLVARFARQLREQARLTEDAAAAATEEELALARAQVRRMGALWEELTQARRELESARETRNVSDRVPSRDGCTSSSLLATFETKFSNSGERTSTPSDGERESGWSECVVWHGERGETSRNGERKKEHSFGGLSFQDCVTGMTRRVRHGDVAAVRVAFDARSGASVLAVTIKEDTEAFAALGACVRCRVDGAVTANRWALEIQKRVDERAERDGRA